MLKEAFKDNIQNQTLCAFTLLLALTSYLISIFIPNSFVEKCLYLSLYVCPILLLLKPTNLKVLTFFLILCSFYLYNPLKPQAFSFVDSSAVYRFSWVAVAGKQLSISYFCILAAITCLILNGNQTMKLFQRKNISVSTFLLVFFSLIGIVFVLYAKQELPYGRNQFTPLRILGTLSFFLFGAYLSQQRNIDMKRILIAFFLISGILCITGIFHSQIRILSTSFLIFLIYFFWRNSGNKLLIISLIIGWFYIFLEVTLWGKVFGVTSFFLLIFRFFIPKTKAAVLPFWGLCSFGIILLPIILVLIRENYDFTQITVSASDRSRLLFEPQLLFDYFLFKAVEDRGALWEAAIYQNVLNYPIVPLVGLEYLIDTPFYTGYWSAPHNAFINLLLSFGIPTGLGVFIFMAYFLFKGISSFILSRDSGIIAIAGSFVSMFIVGFTAGDYILMENVGPLFWSIAGFLATTDIRGSR